MGSQQQFCLRWNNHQSNMLTVFDNLFQNEALVDVTLACEGVSLKAHKMVLSACSPFFQSLFIDNPCKHPIVILKDVRFTDLKALVDFMYKGEVNVSQDQLNRLLKTAETLKVRGLAEVTSGYCIEENGGGGGGGGGGGVSGPAGGAGGGLAPPETNAAPPASAPSLPPTAAAASVAAPTAAPPGYENRTSRSPPRQQMSPPRKRKKTKHRSSSGRSGSDRHSSSASQSASVSASAAAAASASAAAAAATSATNNNSHSEPEPEDSDGGEMLEPKVEITEDNFHGDKSATEPAAGGGGGGGRHAQESPRGANTEDKNEVGYPAGPSATSTPNARSSADTLGQSGMPSIATHGSALTDSQLSNQTSLNTSQGFKLQLLSSDTSTFGSVCVSRLWTPSESQESMEGSLKPLSLFDLVDEDIELVSIGNDVMVDKRKLDILLATTCDSPTRFVRGLLMLVYSKEELRGRSVTGRRRHASAVGFHKDPLECGKLNAVVDYTLTVFPSTSAVKIRQTISNKLKEVNNTVCVGVGSGQGLLNFSNATSQHEALLKLL